MNASSLLRLAFAAVFLALLAFTAPTVHANCGSCGGGDKKDCPYAYPLPCQVIHFHNLSSPVGGLGMTAPARESR